MLDQNGNKIWVVHFHTNMATYATRYPDALQSIRSPKFNHCLSCVAFTEDMLKRQLITIPWPVGLILDPNDCGANPQTCCGEGNGKIRTMCNQDSGRVGLPPCSVLGLGNGCDLTVDDSLNLENPESHNEWVLKPPHKIAGIFFNSASDFVERKPPINISTLKTDFPKLDVFKWNGKDITSK